MVQNIYQLLMKFYGEASANQYILFIRICVILHSCLVAQNQRLLRIIICRRMRAISNFDCCSSWDPNAMIPATDLDDNLINAFPFADARLNNNSFYICKALA